MGKTLIAYFSRSGENIFAGTVKKVDKGNNEIIVDLLQSKVEADIFRIEMLEPYSEDYITSTEQAKADLDNNVRPPLKVNLDSISSYDKVILVTPNYWGSTPMVVRTFCEQFDWSGITVYPICSNEGSGIGNCIAHLRKSCIGARFVPALGIVGSQIADKTEDILAWIEDNRLAK